MQSRWGKRLWRVGLFVVFFVVAFAGVALATHFRYGTLTWKDLGSKNVEFTLTYAERTSFYTTATPAVPITVGATYTDANNIDFGDGSAPTSLTMTVTQVDAANDWFIAKATITHQYSGNGPYTAHWLGSARLSAPVHKNNPDQDWNLQTVVNFANGSPPNAPVSSLPPIVDCPQNSPCSFQVAASGGLSNNALKFRLSTAREGQGSSPPPAGQTAFTQPAGASISPTGLYVWDTTGALYNATGDTYYSTQVMIENSTPAANAPSTPLDFFIRLIPRTAAQLPRQDPTTPPSGTGYVVPPGGFVSIRVQFRGNNYKQITTGIIGLPSGASFGTPIWSFDALNFFTWTPMVADAGSYVINITVTDEDGYSSPPLSYYITVNRPPAFTAAATNTTQTINETQGLASVVAIDPDGDAITDYTLQGGILPSGITLNSDGTFSGTASCTSAGSYTAVIQAIDGYGFVGTTTLSITVQNTNCPPAFPGATTSQTISESGGLATVTATDPDGDPLTYSLQSGTLPAGITLNANGTFSGTADYAAAETAGGLYSVVLKASDGALTVTTTLNITVLDTNGPPAFTAAAANTAQTINETQGLAALAATDPDGDPLTFTVQSGALPAGITLNTNGTFTGTAAYSAAETAGGSYVAVIAVTDNRPGGTVTTTLYLTVANTDTTPTLGVMADVASREADAVAINRDVAADADGDSLTWSATGLPPGVTISATGVMSGKSPYGAAGTYHPVITVTDNTPGGPGGDSASRTFTWTVSPAPPNSELSGTVTTSSGLAAPGLTVTLAYTTGQVRGTTTTDGQGHYAFNGGLSGGTYTVSVAWGPSPVTQSTTVPEHGTQRLDVRLQSAAGLTFVADPPTIMGDGKSTSALAATVVTTEGQPVPGVPVSFTTTAGTVSSAAAASDSQGKATVTLTAPLLNGTTPRTETARAAVYDPQRGISAEATIKITFEPASVQGVITDGSGQPVAGAHVDVAEDFDGDGTIDFTAAAITGPDGRYTIVVPRGDWSYHISVSAPVVIHGQRVMVKSRQTGRVGQLHGAGEKIAAQRTIAGEILATTPNGDTQGVGSLLKLGETVEGSISAADGSPVNATVTVGANGTYEVSGIGPGDYRLRFDVVAPGGQHLLGTSVRVQVSADGELAITTPLIDPYGTVTDAITGKPVGGVKMSLYFADTPLNRQQGHTTGTLVPLPGLPGFAPNQNAVPQVTTAGGQYAWLVFPNADYYIVAEKAGYLIFDSRYEGRTVPVKPGEDSYITDGVIHVGSSIVQFDLRLKAPAITGPVTPAPGGDPSGGPGVQPEQQHRKYIVGYPDNTFRPERSISRAEVAAILYRILELNRVTPTQAPYPDVPVAHWAAGVIGQVTKAGLMRGYPDGNFRPEAPITRAEIAVIVVNFKHLLPLATSPFGDVGDHWAHGVIGSAAQAGVLSGYPGGLFQPDRPMTRAEFVTTVNRLLSRGPLLGIAPTWADVPTSHWAFGNVAEASASHDFLPETGGEKWTRASDLDIWR